MKGMKKMSVIINGYRTKENIGNTTFETIMKKIRHAIEEKQRANYIGLLSEEVCLVSDYYVLNYITINEGRSIMDVAQERLAQRIDEASRTGSENRYNFHIALEIMSFKKRWYFLIVSNNENLTDGILDSIGDLEKYVTTDDEDNITAEQQKVWNEIREKYTKVLQPMRQHYMIQLPLMVKPEDIKFQSVQDRAFYQAENKEYSIIFQSLTKGRAIPPMEIMRYIDEINIERGNAAHAVNVQKNMSQLLVMLPNLTTELISKPCGVLFQAQPDDVLEEIDQEDSKDEENKTEKHEEAKQ